VRCHVCCSVSQCVCSVIAVSLQCVAVCCRLLQCVEMYSRTRIVILKCLFIDTLNTRMRCSVLQCAAVCCTVLQLVDTYTITNDFNADFAANLPSFSRQPSVMVDFLRKQLYGHIVLVNLAANQILRNSNWGFGYLRGAMKCI